MATGNYNIGPQDGWTAVVDAGTTLASVRISCFPHTHPFYVYGGPTAPAATDIGVLVCHHAFKSYNGAATGTDGYWVRVVNPHAGSNSKDGRARIDVYTDGGTVA